MIQALLNPRYLLINYYQDITTYLHGLDPHLSLMVNPVSYCMYVVGIVVS